MVLLIFFGQQLHTAVLKRAKNLFVLIIIIHYIHHVCAYTGDVSNRSGLSLVLFSIHEKKSENTHFMMSYAICWREKFSGNSQKGSRDKAEIVNLHFFSSFKERNYFMTD